MSLSCLFHLPPSCYGPSLDPAFTSLLSEYYRSNMWTTLNAASTVLDTQVDIARMSLKEMKDTLESVYRSALSLIYNIYVYMSMILSVCLYYNKYNMLYV